MLVQFACEIVLLAFALEFYPYICRTTYYTYDIAYNDGDVESRVVRKLLYAQRRARPDPEIVALQAYLNMLRAKAQTMLLVPQVEEGDDNDAPVVDDST